MSEKTWRYPPARLFLAAVAAALGMATGSATAASYQVIQTTVHSIALEGNLLGTSPDRDVTVYLPPVDSEDPGRRYPVVYLLHAYMASNAQWEEEFSLSSVLDSLGLAGALQPMIFVAPSDRNKYGMGLYLNSEVSGNWEDFLTRELVGYVDRTYPTIPDPSHRGIAGHSGGGGSAVRTAMRNPDVFGSVFALSPVGLKITEAPIMPGNPFLSAATWRQVMADEWTFVSGMFLAPAVAICPNPNNSPVAADLPVKEVDGELQPVDEVWQKWIDISPVGMVERGTSRVEELAGIYFDAGDADEFGSNRECRAFSAALSAAGVAHTYEEFAGGHWTRMRERMADKVIPFFAGIFAEKETGTAVSGRTWGAVKGRLAVWQE